MVKENPFGDQLELPLDKLAGAGDIFKNYEKMWRAVTEFIKKIPQPWVRKAVQDKWDEIKAFKLDDNQLRTKFLETTEKDWEEDPTYYYALILEATERKLFL